VYNTLFVPIILCIFVFSCLSFRIYSIKKKQKRKNQKEKNRKQNLPPIELAVGLMKPPFQLAIAASQPAATVAILPPVETFETAAGIQPS
jgi:hypothetical protein